MVNSTLALRSCDDERSFYAQSPKRPLPLARRAAVTMRRPDECGGNAFQKDLKVSEPSTSIPFYPLRIVPLYHSTSWAHTIYAEKT